MRGLRSTLALLALLIGLGAYIYFVASKESVTQGPQQEEVFQGLEATDIQQIEVKAESGDSTTVKKDGESWQMVSPVTAMASESEVSSITTALGQVEITRVIEEQPQDLKMFGLEPPRFEVNYVAADGKPAGKLRVGAKTPAGDSMYAQRNDEPRVFLIPAFQDASLNKNTFDLRDKAILRVERDKIDSIDLTVSGASARFTKEGSDWKLTSPVAARADFGTVDGLVGRLASAQMTSVAATDPSPADLRKFGLDRPAASVALNAGSARATLLVGSEAENDGFYARDASSNTVVTIDRTLAEDLKRSVDEYRRKVAFDFRAFNATRVELTRGDQTLVLERVKGEGENPDTWRRVSPNAADADRSKVETLLTGLADIRAVSFAPTTARTGLEKPVLIAYVKFDEGKREERVTFGRNGADAFFSVPGEPGAARFEAEKLDDAVKVVDELLK